MELPAGPSVPFAGRQAKIKPAGALEGARDGPRGGSLDEAIDAAMEGRRPALKAGGITDKGASARRLPLMAALGAPTLWQAEAPAWRAYANTAGMVLLALALALALQQVMASLNIALVFLTAVLGSAVAYGLWPSLFASLLSVIAYNYFFLPPVYTTTIGDPENVIAMVSFVIVAVIVSNLASRVRSQAIAARQRAQTTEQLYLFSRKLSAAVTLEDLIWASGDHIALMLDVRVVLLLPRDGELFLSEVHPATDSLSEADLAAARWCWANSRAAGRDGEAHGGAGRLFLPLRTGRGVVAVIGLKAERQGALLSADQRRLLEALCDQAALAIERTHLARDVDRARLTAETDRLRSALLTSISHDLRTPLASILGSATSLKTQPEALDETAKREMISTIQEEAERLNRFIGNLLDMTRLESGAVVPRSSMADLSEIVGSALERASRILEPHDVQVRLPPDLPMLNLDVVLFEQVLFNLLDNAGKYTPAGSLIRLEARHENEIVSLQIIDQGDGIPAADRERIFDKFYRIHAADRRRAGTGLGLAICRGFVEAMGGAITAGNRPDGPGAVFTLTLPVPRQLSAPEAK
jgi:two-component system sensor histidine kinase KdpD